MAYLTDLFSMDLFQRMRDERYIRIQQHPTEPLAIANYSELAQFDRLWNEVTLNCRGLIWDYQKGRIVARGFRKFFNWDDASQQYPPHGPVLRSPKMDGSLGILYQDPAGTWAVATRGSFTSDQALWASEALRDSLGVGGGIYLDDLRPGFSYLVEIIYPENRIVVNYGDARRLVLLDVLDTATGKADLDEFDRVLWVDKVERKYFPNGFSDSFGHDIPEGEEGFVVYWPGKDFRVKMKSAEYIELHRAIFSLSERTIWQALGDGKNTEEICVKLPDEFHDWVKGVAETLQVEALRITIDARREFRETLQRVVPEYYDGAPLTDARAQHRKAFAQLAAKSPMRTYLFMLYDGKDIEQAVWKTLRPVGNKTVTTISEDVA
jgi:RNA ligase